MVHKYFIDKGTSYCKCCKETLIFEWKIGLKYFILQVNSLQDYVNLLDI